MQRHQEERAQEALVLGVGQGSERRSHVGGWENKQKPPQRTQKTVLGARP